MPTGFQIFDWKSGADGRRLVHAVSVRSIDRSPRRQLRRPRVLIAAILALVSATASFLVGPAWASIVGSTGVTADLRASTMTESIELLAGYNFISLPLYDYSFTASKLIDSVGQPAQSITRFDVTGQSYVTYDRELASFGVPQEDFKIEPGLGYILYASQTCSLTVIGTLPTSREISLQPGYNLVGWTSATSPRVSMAFINPSNGAVASASFFEKSSGQYVTYDVALASFNIPQPDFQISQGHAYFVFSTAPRTLRYDDSDQSTGNPPEDPNNPRSPGKGPGPVFGGRLHTEGRYIFDELGNNIALRGGYISYNYGTEDWGDWDQTPEQYDGIVNAGGNYADIGICGTSHGADTSTDEAYLATLDTAIDYCWQKNLYVGLKLMFYYYPRTSSAQYNQDVIDEVNAGPGSAQWNRRAAWWKNLATRYSQRAPHYGRHLLWHIGNEPPNSISMNNWRNYATTMVDAIQSVIPGAVIIMPKPHVQQPAGESSSSWNHNYINRPNIIYSVHRFYCWDLVNEHQHGKDTMYAMLYENARIEDDFARAKAVMFDFYLHADWAGRSESGWIGLGIEEWLDDNIPVMHDEYGVWYDTQNNYPVETGMSYHVDPNWQRYLVDILEFHRIYGLSNCMWEMRPQQDPSKKNAWSPLSIEGTLNPMGGLWAANLWG